MGDKAGTVCTAVAIPGMVLAVLTLAYAFRVGMVEAGSFEPWMRPVIPAYCWPAHQLERIPLVGVFVRLADQMDYEFADGPETTR